MPFGMSGLSKIFGIDRTVNYRRQGDERRNAHDWSGAAAAYALHLEENPSDQPIWIQLGHAWKEQDLLEKAVTAYQTGVDLDKRDIDANLHLADVLLRLGRSETALATYEHINEITPNSEAIRQIRALRRNPAATPATDMGNGTVFFAIQDLFGYLNAHVTMSGIQRVQAGIAAHAIADAAIDARFILSNTAGATLPAGEFWMLDNEQVMRIITYASGQSVCHDTLREMLASCEDTAKRVRPVEGSTIVLLGAFWGLGNGTREFVPSKRDGVRIGAYVYDIIPITHPEFCDNALVIDFSMAICELCATADFILTISDATQVVVKEFIEQNGGRPVPMATVPLAHHLTKEINEPVRWPTQLARVRGRRYVAYVSTIEGRKNHIYVVNAWRRLIAEGVNVPDLVFVGRQGWKIGGLTDVLTATDNLNGRLHIAHDLSDGELNAVYAGCEFSVFTSFVEGWGLPVGESLFHGRPCVASNTSSIPEVGGDLVDYVNPFDLADGVDVLRRLITQPAYLRQRVDAICDRFVARTWSDVGTDFLAKVKNFQTTPIVPFRAILGEGKISSLVSMPGDRVDVKQYFRTLDRLLIESDALYGREDQGAWLRGNSPEISIATNLTPGTTALAYMQLLASPGAQDCRLRILDTTSGQETAPILLREIHPARAIRLAVRAGEDGSLRLRFDISGAYVSPAVGDTRDFAVGLRSIGYAQSGNIAARQEIAEAMSMQDLAITRR